jgi:uncharacterized protein YukE
MPELVVSYTRGGSRLGGDFSVHPEELAAGAGVIDHLGGRAVSIGSQLEQALRRVAQAAGDADLTVVLEETGATSTMLLMRFGTLYQHISDGLRTTAQSYRSVDDQVAGHLRAIYGRPQ